MNSKHTIEICAANIQSALAAEAGGASRIELCDNLYEGGTTPSYATINMAVKNLSIEVMVMIRPRGGDFCYSDMEFEIMKQDIEICKELGVHGVVFGILLPDGQVDEKRTQELVVHARPLEVTFHRAFDMTPEPDEALETLIRCGVDRLLTAGHQNTVPEGRALIRQLVKQAGNRITVMPGSGLNEENIRSLRDFTGAREFHLTGRVATESRMTFRKTHIFMGGLPQIPEYKILISSSQRIQKIVSLVGEP